MEWSVRQSSTAQFAFVDKNSDGTLLYVANGFSYDYDDRYIFNRVQVSTPRLGAPVEKNDATSVTAYGENTLAVATLCRDVNDATAYADVE